MSEVRGSSLACQAVMGKNGLEELPRIQGMVAVWVQEGLEELSDVEGQEGRR